MHPTDYSMNNSMKVHSGVIIMRSNITHIAYITTVIASEYKSKFKSTKKHLIPCPYRQAMRCLLLGFRRKLTTFYQHHTVLISDKVGKSRSKFSIPGNSTRSWLVNNCVRNYSSSPPWPYHLSVKSVGASLFIRYLSTLNKNSPCFLQQMAPV